MRPAVFLVLLLPALPVRAGDAGLELAGYVSAWTQDCSGGSCALPVPGQRNVPVRLAVTPPSEPGQASGAHASEKLALGSHGEISVELSFYAICPYGGEPGACAGRYFQAQALVAGPAGASCTVSLNEADFAPFPVLTCAGVAGDRRFGVTLHRKPL
ncbi:MAG: hypothetical protein HY952_00895 [Elusimicrobia bacterium]|nr:hypothetical protein [Elusimicrobiota bacterium]